MDRLDNDENAQPAASDLRATSSLHPQNQPTTRMDSNLERRSGIMRPLSDNQDQSQASFSGDPNAFSNNRQEMNLLGRGGYRAGRCAGPGGRVSQSGHIRGRQLSPEEDRIWRSSLDVGSELDVKDTVHKWCEASVLELDANTKRIRVHYEFWAPKWDEWIDIDSERLVPPGTKAYVRGGPFEIDQRVSALDELGHWREAYVIDVRGTRARLHFRGFGMKYHKWVEEDGGEVQPYRPLRRSNRAKVTVATGQQHIRQIAQLSRRYEHYMRALEAQGLRVVPIEGDGNCLFRSVSHQIYGDDRYHGLVRARCMDYMESEAPFFAPFIEGDMEAFHNYLDIKRRNAVWGDDPEVQALCEIYDRPAEIWAYDQQLGAKTLRTFHEAAGASNVESVDGASRCPPMRLSYYGGGHYDSVISIAGSTASTGTSAFSRTNEPRRAGVPAVALPEPGQLEEQALERSRRRAAEVDESGRWDPEEMKLQRDSESLDDQSTVDIALRYSRNGFEAQNDNLDTALIANVDQMEQSNLRSLEATAHDRDLLNLQEQMLRTAQEQSEEHQLKSALELSVQSATDAETEADMVQQAIAESMMGTNAESSERESGGAAASTDEAATRTAPNEGAALAQIADEEEDLKRALALSGAGNDWDIPESLQQAFESVDDDDPELRHAIQASLTGE